jgi:hypothetical protein
MLTGAIDEEPGEIENLKEPRCLILTVIATGRGVESHPHLACSVRSLLGDIYRPQALRAAVLVATSFRPIKMRGDLCQFG